MSVMPRSCSSCPVMRRDADRRGLRQSTRAWLRVTTISWSESPWASAVVAACCCALAGRAMASPSREAATRLPNRTNGSPLIVLSLIRVCPTRGARARCRNATSGRGICAACRLGHNPAAMGRPPIKQVSGHCRLLEKSDKAGRGSPRISGPSPPDAGPRQRGAKRILRGVSGCIHQQ